MNRRFRRARLLLIAAILSLVALDSVSADSRIHRKLFYCCCPQPVCSLSDAGTEPLGAFETIYDPVTVCMKEMLANFGNGNCMWLVEVCESGVNATVLADCNAAGGESCPDCSVTGWRYPQIAGRIQNADGNDISIPFYSNNSARAPRWVSRDRLDPFVASGWELSRPTFVRVQHNRISFHFALYSVTNTKDKSNVKHIGVRVDRGEENDVEVPDLYDPDERKGVVASFPNNAGTIREVAIIYDGIPYHVHVARDDDPDTNDETW